MSMKFKNKRILCVGEVLWDRLPTGSVPGGAPMNVALHLTQLDQEAMFASSVGDDEAGRKLIKFMKNAGLNVELIQKTYDLPTSEVIVSLDRFKSPTFNIVEPVAWDQIELNDSIQNAAKGAGSVIYGTLASRNLKTRETILALLKYDNLKLLDINLRPPYDKREIVEQLLAPADFVKLNDTELIKIAEWNNFKSNDLRKLINWFSENYNKNFVCVTRGKDGAMVLEDHQFVENDGFKVTPVDTVGSGDAFLAGFISSIINGMSIKDALNFACGLGSYVATKPGATPQLNHNEIKVILNQKHDTGSNYR